jgi:putative nucleotidyltransferase with HDIG domain
LLPSAGIEPIYVKGLRVAEVVSALSQALDLGSGASAWHSVRTCILGMRIASELGLPEAIQSELYYALLLKDAGCSSNASEIYNALSSDEISAKGAVKKLDWTRVNRECLDYALAHVALGKPFWERLRTIMRVATQQKKHTQKVVTLRCERGATLARLMGLGEGTATGIAGLDEHWGGSGNPDGLSGSDIPLSSCIMLLAQTLDVFFTDDGPEAAIEIARQRSGRWFAPDLVKAARSLSSRRGLWSGLCEGRDREIALGLEPSEKFMADGHVTLDSVCQAFAHIVDAKSPFTCNHSNGVANAAVAIAKNLDLSEGRVLFVRHAALLHDLGKMAVSNAVLEKPGKLDENEWQAMRSHPEFTLRILRPIRGFEEMSEIAASHHEKLDGTGYFRGLRAEQMSTEARILVVADIFDALSANRPYRAAMPLEKVYKILRQDAPHALDAECVEALERSGIECDQTFHSLHALQRELARWSTGLEAMKSADGLPAKASERGK